eukprot:6302281-Heterocapsa_arctica.AAC.1
MRRWQGASARRYPVTIDMLHWIWQHLQLGRLLPADAAVLWLAVTLAWFFLLRASEYLALPGNGDRALCGMDMELRNANKACVPNEAEEL